MRLVLLVALVVSVGGATAASSKACHLRGVNFALKQNERQTGRALVEQINSQKKLSWKAAFSKRFAQTKLADLKLLAGVKNDFRGVYAREATRAADAVPTYTISDKDIPKEFDSRKAWPACAKQIGQIADQSLCGSCFAISSTNALADRFCIKTSGKIRVDLSAAEIMSCCTECGAGCVGGYPIKAYQYMQENGVVSGGNYSNPSGCSPYPFPPCEHGNGDEKGNYPVCRGRHYKPKGCAAKCTNKKYKNEFDDDKYYVMDAYTFNNDPKRVQKELMTNGPLVFTALRMFEDFLYYRSGVYQHTSGRFLGLHAIRVIGWGVENDVDYWLVANSWNMDWGDNGFFKIRRGVNEAGIESVADAALPDLERSAHAAGYVGDSDC